jgi:hypothetical protein
VYYPTQTYITAWTCEFSYSSTVFQNVSF